MRLDPGLPLQKSMMSVKPAELPGYVKSLYRIKPDRRILYAIEEIERLASNRKRPATLSVRFDRGVWRLSLKGVDVGSLPEIPSSSDCQKLLAEWTRRQLSAHVAAAPADRNVLDFVELEQEFGKGSTEAGVGVLKEVDRLWARHPFDPRLVGAAARNLVWLGAVTCDALGLSDPLIGKALALVTIADFYDPAGAAGDKALLWYLLGYGTAAESSSERLPADDPVRQFVRWEFAGIPPESLAQQEPRKQYLYLWDLARRDRRKEFYSALDSSVFSGGVDFAVLTLLARLNDFETARESAQAIVFTSYLAVTEKSAGNPSVGQLATDGFGTRLDKFFEETGKRVPIAPESRTRRFEELLEDFSTANDGPILDRESLRAVYGAPFYSGIHNVFWFCIGPRSDTDAAERYAELLKDPAPGVASELREWMLDRVQLNRGRVKAEKVAKDMNGFSHLGIFPIVWAAETVSGAVDSPVDPSNRLATQILFSQLDTRPFGLSEAGRVSYAIWNLLSSDQYLQALSQAAPRDRMVPTIANRLRDTEWLRRVARDPTQTVSNRLWALAHLQSLGEKDQVFLRDRYRELRDQEPQSVSVLDGQVAMLERAGDRGKAIEALNAWLEAHGERWDLDRAHVITRKAQELQLGGRLREAWETIEPAIDTWKGEVLERAASIREEQGRLDEALRIARMARERYPESAFARAGEARILWRQGKHNEAAALLRAAPGISRSHWSATVADAFQSAFAKASPEQAEKALTALKGKGIRSLFLAEMVKGASSKLDPKLVVRLYSSMALGGSEAASVSLWTFDALEKTNGRNSAVAWLRQHERLDHQLTLIIYQQQRYEMLWDLASPEWVAEKDDVLQVLRVAALLSQCKSGDSRRQALVSYFESRPKSGIPLLGLYLLGRCDREALFAQVKTVSDIADVAWAVGLEAAAAGRYEEASDWFQVCVETGVLRFPPVAWAADILYRWNQSGKTLRLVANDQIF